MKIQIASKEIEKINGGDFLLSCSEVYGRNYTFMFYTETSKTMIGLVLLI